MKLKINRKQNANDNTVLVLRTCRADMTSYNNFVWPTSGLVEAADWVSNYTCGNGLHGLLWGCGSVGYLSMGSDAKWLVVRVDKADLLHGKGDLQDKCKFKKGIVEFCGTRDDAIKYLLEHGAESMAVVFGTATAGDGGTATAGDGGTATAGDGGTATAGYGGTATAGDRGTATAGYGGTATAGDGGTATAGDGGTATAGYGGTATAGDRGTATAGYGGTATAGYRGTLVLKYYDGDRYRLVIGYVGENGIQPNKSYCVIDGKLVIKE